MRVFNQCRFVGTRPIPSSLSCLEGLSGDVSEQIQVTKRGWRYALLEVGIVHRLDQ